MKTVTLQAHPFGRLLSGGRGGLAGDADYERFRLELIRLFSWHGSNMPEEDADETILRVLDSLERGIVIRDLGSYARKVALNVLMESRRAKKKMSVISRGAPDIEKGSREDIVREGCLERCKRNLNPEELYLIEKYYIGEKGAKIRSREMLAAELGIDLKALRLRAYRIRMKLAECVKKCEAESR